MAIKAPTSLVIDLNTDLRTEISTDQFISHRFITDTIQLPFGSYTVGSIDITRDMSSINLGTASAGILLSDTVINVILGENNPIHTKLFAYDGNQTTFTISTESLTPITVEYIIGEKLPTVPTPPTLISAESRYQSALVTFDSPVENGGKPITSYTVTASPGNITATGSSSPITVNGLTTGNSYTFTVVATNAIGNSANSNRSDGLVISNPYTVPDAPTIVDLSMNDRSVSIYFNGPENDGGLPITQYIAVSNPGGISATSTESPVVVENLSYGTQYTFTVRAVNDVGQSAPSNVSDPETPMGFPDAPVITDATMNYNVATISFTTPNDNGNPIIDYMVITQPTGNITRGPSSPIDVPNLWGGTDYTFVVIAETNTGNGGQSAPSQTLTAVANVPSKPTIDFINVTSDSASIYFSQPDDGGASIINWTAADTGNNISVTDVQSPITVNGLSSGQTYTFTIQALNGVGYSDISDPVSTTTY